MSATMDRISPQAVETASRITGLQVTDGVYLDEDCGCPITLIALMDNPKLEQALRANHVMYSYGAIKASLGSSYDPDYLLGFLGGFDQSEPMSSGWGDAQVMGYRDGALVRAWFLEAA